MIGLRIVLAAGALTLLGAVQPAFAQTTRDRWDICVSEYFRTLPSGDGGPSAEQTETGSAAVQNDTEILVREIAASVGLNADSVVVIPCRFISKAQTIYTDGVSGLPDGQHVPAGSYIVYNATWVREVIGSDRVQAIALFGHELSHLLNNDFLPPRSTLARSEREADADHFAGCAVARLGGSWAVLHDLLTRLRDEEGGLYPGQFESLAAARSGFDQCSQQQPAPSPPSDQTSTPAEPTQPQAEAQPPTQTPPSTNVLIRMLMSIRNWLIASADWLTPLSALAVTIGAVVNMARGRQVARRRAAKVITNPLPDPRSGTITQSEAVPLRTKLPKGRIQRLVARAEAALAANEAAKAKELLLRAAALPPRPSKREAPQATDFGEAYGLADRQWRLGDVETTRKTLELALALGLPETATLAHTAHMGLATLDRHERKLGAALKRLTKSAEDMRQIAKSESEDDLVQLGAVLNELGNVQLASGEIAKARATYAEGVKLRKALVERASQQILGLRQQELIYALSGAAATFAHGGALSDAVNYAVECEDLARRLSQANPGNVPVALTALRVASQLADLRRLAGDTNSATLLTAENAAAYRELVADTKNDDVQFGYVQCLLQLAAMREVTGDVGGALQESRSALTQAQTLLEKFPKSDAAANLAVSAWSAVARYEHLGGRLDETDRATVAAMDILRAQSREDPEDAETKFLLAGLWLQRAGGRLSGGEVEEATEFTNAAIVLCERLLGIDPTRYDVQQTLIEARLQLGELRALSGKLDDALEVYDDCLATAERLKQGDPTSVELIRQAARVRQRYGATLNSAGDASGAARALSDADKALRELTELDPGNIQARIDRIGFAVVLVDSYRRMGDLGVAEQAADEAIALAEVLAEKDPSSAEIKRGLAACLQGKASVETYKMNLRGALDLYQRAVAILDELKAAHPNAEALRASALALGSLGTSYRELGERSAAERSLLNAIDLFAEALKKSAAWGIKLDLLWTRARLVELYDEKATLEKAQQHVEILANEVAELNRQVKGIAAIEEMLAVVEEKRGDVLFTAERYEEAKAYYQLSFARREKLLAKSRKNLDLFIDAAGAKSCIGEAEYMQGQADLALLNMEKAKASMEEALAKSPKDQGIKWMLLLPRLRIAQIQKDESALRELTEDLRELEKGGRARVGKRLPWLAELRALASGSEPPAGEQTEQL